MDFQNMLIFIDFPHILVFTSVLICVSQFESDEYSRVLSAETYE